MVIGVGGDDVNSVEDLVQVAVVVVAAGVGAVAGGVTGVIEHDGRGRRLGQAVGVGRVGIAAAVAGAVAVAVVCVIDGTGRRGGGVVLGQAVEGEMPVR